MESCDGCDVEWYKVALAPSEGCKEYINSEQRENAEQANDCSVVGKCVTSWIKEELLKMEQLATVLFGVQGPLPSKLGRKCVI